MHVSKTVVCTSEASKKWLVGYDTRRVLVPFEASEKARRAHPILSLALLTKMKNDDIMMNDDHDPSLFQNK